MEVRRINPTVAILLTVLALSLIGSASASNIYRWTAPDGTVSYGSTPPPDVEAERLRGAPPPASGPRQDRDSQDPTAEAVDSAGGASDRKSAANGETQRERECARARENLEILENPAVRRIQTDGGEAQPLTEDMREEMLQETREFLDEWCR